MLHNVSQCISDMVFYSHIPGISASMSCYSGDLAQLLLHLDL